MQFLSGISARHAWFRTLLACICASFIACSDSNAPRQPVLQKPKPDPYTIRFVTINSPDTYFIDSQNNYAGLEYDLAKRFVDFLGAPYKLEFIVVDSFDKVFPTLMRGDADIAAADISITAARKRQVLFGPAFNQVQAMVVYNRDQNSEPGKPDALLNKRIVLPKSTSFVERMRELQSKHPQLTWRETDKLSSEQLIEAVARNEIDFTVADNHLLSIMQYLYPQLDAGLMLGQTDKIAWALNKLSGEERLKQVQAFFKQIEKDGSLRNLLDRYYGHTKRLKQVDVTAFLSKSHTLLPKYIRLFKSAQEITDIDWRLLAGSRCQCNNFHLPDFLPINQSG